MIERTREKVMVHMLNGDNIGLITSRLTKGEEFAHVQVTKNISEVICMSAKTSNNGFLFPLYLNTDDGDQRSLETERRPNLSPGFLKVLRDKLKLPVSGEHGLPEGISAETIFNYVYAILHSSEYRMRYLEFLKTAFPRIPLTSDANLFFDLASIGGKLVDVQVLDERTLVKPSGLKHRFEGIGDGIVEKSSIKWESTTECVYINKTQYFEGVSKEVWGMHVGGYIVAEKWLKERDRRILSFDEQSTYRKILTSLDQTFTLMKQIDERISSWPIE